MRYKLAAAVYFNEIIMTNAHKTQCKVKKIENRYRRYKSIE